MNILLVSNKAVFEAYLVGAYYLNQELDNNIFGNMDLDDRKEPVFIGTDHRGNQVYALGNAVPHRVVLVYDELARVDNWQSNLGRVVAVTGDWIWLTVVLAKLAALPFIGTLFKSTACSWAKSHHEKLKLQARSLSVSLDQTEALPAAKPLI